MLLVGDSMMMEGFGPVLQRTRASARIWSGARRQIFDRSQPSGLFRIGPRSLRSWWEVQPGYGRDLHGANDPQDIIDENRKRHHADSESWKTIYRSRAERLLAVATAWRVPRPYGSVCPSWAREPYSTRVRRLSELQKEACETYHAAFVDTVKVLADAQGNYTTFKVDDRDATSGCGIRIWCM